MGELDEEERQYLLIDKDTGKVYDLRNENHLHKITAKSTRITQDLNSTTSSNVNNQSTSKGQGAWGDWWKDKKRNNQDLLWAAENGNLEEVRKLLDKALL